MAWYNQSRRHSLASQGIKTAQRLPRVLKEPTIHLLKNKEFEAKLGKDFDIGKEGEARTDIEADGSVNIYIKDIDDEAFQDKILRHEKKEIEIWQELVNKGMSPEEATKVAHEQNPIKIDNFKPVKPPKWLTKGIGVNGGGDYIGTQVIDGKERKLVMSWRGINGTVPLPAYYEENGKWFRVSNKKIDLI